MRTEIKNRKDMYENEFYDLYIDGKFHQSYLDKIEASIDEKEIIEEKLKGVCI